MKEANWTEKDKAGLETLMQLYRSNRTLNQRYEKMCMALVADADASANVKTCARAFHQWQRLVERSAAKRSQKTLGRLIKKARQKNVFLRRQLQDTIHKSDQRHVRDAEKIEALEKDVSSLEMQASSIDRMAKEQQRARLQQAKDELNLASFKTCACVFNQWQRMATQSVNERVQEKLGQAIEQARWRHEQDEASVIHARTQLQDAIRQSGKYCHRESEKCERLEEALSSVEMQASLSERVAKERQTHKLKQSKDELKFASNEFRAEALSAFISLARCEQHEARIQELDRASANQQAMMQHEACVAQRQIAILEEQLAEHQCHAHAQQHAIDFLAQRLRTQESTWQDADTQTETNERWSRAAQTKFASGTHERQYFNTQKGGISADERFEISLKKVCTVFIESAHQVT